MQTITPPHDHDDLLPDVPLDRGSRLRRRAGREIRRALIDPAIGPDDPAAYVPSTDDRLALFTPMVTAVRVATTAISLLLAAPRVLDGDALITISAVVVVAYATFRSIRPIRYSTGLESLNRTLLEAFLLVLIVVATGFWASPFVFTLLSVVVIAGFARGFAFGLRIALSSAVAVTAPAVYLSTDVGLVLMQGGTWAGLLVMISVVSGYGRQVSGEADRERDIALDRLGRLADANALLYSLHRVAQTLPSSLDMSDVLSSTVVRLRELIDFDSIVILLFDDTDGHWQVIRQEGCHVAARLDGAALPPPMVEAIAVGSVVTAADLGEIDGRGFDDRSRSGLFSALSTRGNVMGLIALEHRDANRFDHRAAGLLAGFVPPLAMALDNARWFARLRTVGADEERTRIARDLHDRIGQSLAYLAFELDRIVNRHSAGDSLGSALEDLRGDVRGVIREVRDTLYDLRTDVSDAAGLDEILEQYANRVSERTTLRFEVDADSGQRLPLLQEREMWRIAQEAITNIERHAHARTVRITWRCDGGRAAIRITDDGIGFASGRAGRLDSYGMLGMRERASSIGATLEVQSTPGEGTSITCVLDPSLPPSQPDDRLKPGAKQ